MRRSAAAGLPAWLGVGRRPHPQSAGIDFAVISDRCGHDTGRRQSRRQLQGATAGRRDAVGDACARSASARRPAAVDVPVSSPEVPRPGLHAGPPWQRVAPSLLCEHRHLHRSVGGTGRGRHRRRSRGSRCAERLRPDDRYGPELPRPGSRGRDVSPGHRPGQQRDDGLADGLPAVRTGRPAGSRHQMEAVSAGHCRSVRAVPRADDRLGQVDAEGGGLPSVREGQHRRRHADGVRAVDGDIRRWRLRAAQGLGWAA